MGYDDDDNRKPGTCWLVDSPPVRLGIVPSPALEFLTQNLQASSYDTAGRPLTIDNWFDTWALGGGFDGHRTLDFTYDSELGYLDQLDTTHQNYVYWNSALTRTFQYGNDPDGLPVQITGADGQSIYFTHDGQPGYDELGRASTVTRNGMSATYTYDDARRLTRIDYGNGAWVERVYDNANRLTDIRHWDADSKLLFEINYVWALDNVIDSRTETDYTVAPAQVATVVFDYDNNHRLTYESRAVNSSAVYDITYTYDKLGNRLSKADTVSGLVTTYFYDADPANRELGYATNNNRLLWYEVKDSQEHWLRTVRYVYYKTGDVSNITIKDEYVAGAPGSQADYDWYHDLSFYYRTNQRMSLALWDRWKMAGQQLFTDYERLAAREFGYDHPIARYLDRDVDKDTFEPLAGPQRWTDHVGVMPYNDFEMTLDGNDEPQATETMGYLGGASQQTVSGGAIDYLHGDLIGSTNMLTDAGGGATATTAYTAFGEPIGPGGVGFPPAIGTRYGYAGKWGYESGLVERWGVNTDLPPITLQHVGYRWYDASIGRFVQRDPVGINGGLNVYAYVYNNSVILVDPSGLYWDYDDIPQLDGSIIRNYYDRGWFGLKNEFQYGVRVPAGKPPPPPPRQIDQRVKACLIAGAVTGTAGAIRGAVGGAAGGPQGVVAGGLVGYGVGWVCGIGGGIIREFTLD